MYCGYVSLRGRLKAIIAVVFTIGCSSDPDPEQTASAGGSGPMQVGQDVRMRCLDFARRLCESAENCCRSSYGGFDLDGCIAELDSDVCRPGGDTVQAGLAEYDDTAEDACLAAHAEAHAVCVPDFMQTIELRKQIFSSCKVLRGFGPPGQGCTTRITCEQPDGPVSADCVRGQCSLIEVLPQDATCPYPDGEVSVCDNGLYCTAAGRGESGICAPATGLAEVCDSAMLGNQECGLGNYCDLVDSTCKPATNFGGPSCSQGTECVSLLCDRVAGECNLPPAVVAESLCLGSN